MSANTCRIHAVAVDAFLVAKAAGGHRSSFRSLRKDEELKRRILFRFGHVPKEDRPTSAGEYAILHTRTADRLPFLGTTRGNSLFWANVKAGHLFVAKPTAIHGHLRLFIQN